MEQNRFIKYNHSLLINVFMSNEYKYIRSENYVPNYNEINKQNARGWTALMRVFELSNINIFRLLLSHPDIDISVKNNGGYTALTLASIYNRINLIKALIPFYLPQTLKTN